MEDVSELAGPSRAAASVPTPRSKVVHLIYFDGFGGGPKSFVRLLNYFAQKQDLVAIAGGKGSIYEACLRSRIPYYEVPIHKKSTCWYGFWILVWRLWRLKPDLLVLHGQWAGPVGAVAGKLAGVKRMIYIARWPAFYTSWDLFRLIRNFIAEYIPCRLCQRTITLSESNCYQYLVRQWATEEKLMMIPNAVNPGEVPSAEQARLFRRRWGWADEHTHVVSVGRLSTQKRIDWLLESWKIVQERCPQARLWIVGEGPLQAELEKMAKDIGVDSTCKFIGAQQGLLAITASDLVAMTTLYEGRANVPMESLLCGKPIVANNADGVGDTFQHGRGGYLVEVGLIEEFADRLIELIQNPDLRRAMGEIGRKEILRYQVGDVMKQYETAFADVLDDKPMPSS